MIIVDPPLTRLDVWRVVLGVLGVGLIAAGGLIALAWLPADQYAGLIVWVIAGIVLHDGLLAPLVAIAALAGARAARWMGPTLAAVARTGFAVAACCALVAFPGIVVRAQGPRNATIHTVDYTAVLGVIWLLAVALAVSALAVAAVRSRRVRARTM